MTHAPLAAWLDARTPPPPPELAARLHAMTAPFSAREATAEVLLDAAHGAMTTLLRDGCLTRPAALDLLAIDALVTYAFEATADEPERIDDRARQALARIAALAESYPA
jgi:hypothetical protein